MPHWGKLFLLYLLSTAGLIAPIFLGDMTLFYKGMTVTGVILITNSIVVAFQMHLY